MRDSHLEQNRRSAALMSRGGSSDAIHTSVRRELDAAGARGAALDFGAGSGELARSLFLSERFDSVVAADLVDYGDARGHGVEWVFGDLNEPLPLADGSFDTLVAVEVVEHLENPRAVAREWFRLLRPGGVLVVTTPNVESWRSILSFVARAHFVSFGDSEYPAHITAMTRKDLARVLAEAGFSDARMFYSDRGALPKLTQLTWQRVSGGRLRGLRYSDNFGCVTRKPGHAA